MLEVGGRTADEPGLPRGQGAVASASVSERKSIGLPPGAGSRGCTGRSCSLRGGSPPACREPWLRVS